MIDLTNAEGDWLHETEADEEEDVEKEWVSDPTEQAPNRWTNTETGEYRYQESKPDPDHGDDEKPESNDSDDDESGQESLDQAELEPEDLQQSSMFDRLSSSGSVEDGMTVAVDWDGDVVIGEADVPPLSSQMTSIEDQEGTERFLTEGVFDSYDVYRVNRGQESEVDEQYVTGRAHEIVDRMKETYNTDAAGINAGQCQAFAFELKEEIEEAGGEANIVGGEDFGHVWVYNDGKHYDSEHPEGVDDWKDLSIWRRVFHPFESVEDYEFEEEQGRFIEHSSNSPTDDAEERVYYIAEKAAEEVAGFTKEWVSDPTERAPDRWTNTETGEHRYQEAKPQTGTGLTDEGEGGGAVGDQELRRAIEQLENPSREDVQEYFGLDEVDWSVYEDEGVDSFDLSTAVSMTLSDYDTMEEFNSAVESGEFDVELQDNYSLYSDPDDLAQLEGEIAQNIRDDAAQMHVEELVTEDADAVRSVTDEPEIPQDGEDGETTEDEEDGNGGGYEDEYESFGLHNVEFSEVSEDDYLVIDGRRGREKIKVQSVDEEKGGEIVISGVTPDGHSSGVISDREESQILGQLEDGGAYKSGVERGVRETIEQYEDTVQEVKDSFTDRDIRDGLEEFDAGRQGSFKRLSSSAAMELRSSISDAVRDKEAVDELWARMNEMKQSSTGRQRKYVDALAKETFGMEDADTWGDADPDDYDFSEADKEAMAVTAAASHRVLSQAGDNKIHRGVREGGPPQLAKAWLEDPMETEFEINENATANYTSLEDVARGYGDITVDKDVTEGAILNANDMIRGMYRSSAAADEAEVWAPGSKQTVSSWDVSIGSERVEGEYERMYLGDYQGPIEEIEDEKFLRRMGKQIEHLQESEDIDSLSDEAKKNLQKFGERMDEVLSDYDFDEVVDELMNKEDEESVIDLTDEAGWLDEVRDGEDSEDDVDGEELAGKFVKRLMEKYRVYVDSPSDAPDGALVRQGPSGAWFYYSNQTQENTKTRVYISSPDEAPENCTVRGGPSGGYYYYAHEHPRGRR
jgi:hypothetical protein